MKFNFVGLNEKQTLAVRELSATLGFEIDAEGTKVKVVAGENLSVSKRCGVYTVKYSRPCELYRAISYLANG